MGVEAQPPSAKPTRKPGLPASSSPSRVFPGTLLAPPRPARCQGGRPRSPSPGPGPADSRGADAGPRPRRATQVWSPSARHPGTPGSRQPRRAGDRRRSRRSCWRGEQGRARGAGAGGAESALPRAGEEAGAEPGLPRAGAGLAFLGAGAGADSEFPDRAGLAGPHLRPQAQPQGGVAGPSGRSFWSPRGARVIAGQPGDVWRACGGGDGGPPVGGRAQGGLASLLPSAVEAFQTPGPGRLGAGRRPGACL